MNFDTRSVKWTAILEEWHIANADILSVSFRNLAFKNVTVLSQVVTKRNLQVNPAAKAIESQQPLPSSGPKE
jgi:hypothetical protein